MEKHVLVRFRYASEVRLDFPELDLAVILKGRLQVEPGRRLPLRAHMLRGDVYHLMNGLLKTNADLAHTYKHAIQDSRGGDHRFGTRAVEPLEINEVRTISKEGKQPPYDWLFGWVRYASSGDHVTIELRDGTKIRLAGVLPDEIAGLPKYARVHPQLLVSMADGCTGFHAPDKLEEVIRFSYIRHAPSCNLVKIAGLLQEASLKAGSTSIRVLKGTEEEKPTTPSGNGYKQDTGKLDYNLLMRDLAPQVEQIVKVLHWGHHTKGYPRNGFRTLPDAEGRFMAATQRHLAAMAKDALAKDSESGLPHAIHVIANQLMMLAALEDKQ